jgi:hypothetical protein
MKKKRGQRDRRKARGKENAHASKKKNIRAITMMMIMMSSSTQYLCILTLVRGIL